MSKVIVIGAGIGGMSAAARLAKAGHDVTIFEGSDRTGGKCRTKWIGNYAFDTGPSLLTLPAVYRDLFLKTGKRIEHILKIDPVDPAFEYNFADKTKITFPNLSLKGTCDSIESVLGKEAGNQWHNLMQRAEHMWDVSRGPFVESELKSISSLIAKKGFLGNLKVIAPLTSLRKLTGKYTSNPYLSKIIDRYATYSGSDPRKVPAVLLTIAFVESSFGAWHIKGGIGQLSNAIEDRCRELGVKFELNTSVTRITTDNSAATGVEVNGKFYPADFVVANADAELVYNKLLDRKVNKVSRERKKLAKATKSLAGFSLLLGLDNSKISGPAPVMPHHSIYFPEDYDAEFDDIFVKKIPVNDPTIYICAPTDSDMVKGNNLEAWSVLINAPRHEPGTGWDWNNDSALYAAKIIAKLDELGLRVSERIEVMEFQTPADLEQEVSAPGGSIYGTSSNGARSAFLRASNTSPLKNLYCVGGSAHPGGGLPLVGISAEIVAEAIGPK
jgi:phytoene desaturase